MKINFSVDDYYITPEQLGEAIEGILTEYSGTTRAAIKDAVTETTRDAKKEIKANANVEKGNRFPYRRGKYKKSISYRMETAYYSDTGIIYAKDHEYSLTHLLENGHKLWNAPGKRTRAFPHWKKGEELAIQELPQKIKDKLTKG